MTVISKEMITNIQSSEELIDLIGKNIYQKENYNLIDNEVFIELPTYAQNVILILDFETEYEMEGIYTLINNSIGKSLEKIASSFEQTNNPQIAFCIKEIHLLSEKYGLENQEILAKISNLDSILAELINNKDFWGNVRIYLSQCMVL
jgi:hypothetical protein